MFGLKTPYERKDPHQTVCITLAEIDWIKSPQIPTVYFIGFYIWLAHVGTVGTDPSPFILNPYNPSKCNSK